MTVEELLASRNVYFIPKGADCLVSCLHPDHEDRNPSMRIDRITGIFQCFSCGNIRLSTPNVIVHGAAVFWIFVHGSMICLAGFPCRNSEGVCSKKYCDNHGCMSNHHWPQGKH